MTARRTDGPVRVGLLGGESTGKSTLAAELAGRMDAVVVDECTRRFVETHARPPRADEQADLLREQADAVRAASRLPGASLVVADPAPLMTAVYSAVYFDDDGLLPIGIDDALTYDLLVWCAPDFPWRPDPGMRDGPQFRTAADRVLGRLVAGALSSPRAPVLRVSGAPAARAAAVLSAVPRGRGTARPPEPAT